MSPLLRSFSRHLSPSPYLLPPILSPAHILTFLLFLFHVRILRAQIWFPRSALKSRPTHCEKKKTSNKNKEGFHDNKFSAYYLLQELCFTSSQSASTSIFVSLINSKHVSRRHYPSRSVIHHTYPCAATGHPSPHRQEEGGRVTIIKVSVAGEARYTHHLALPVGMSVCAKVWASGSQET